MKVKTTYPDKMCGSFNDWAQHIAFESWRMKFGKSVKNQIHESIKKNTYGTKK